MMKLGLQMNIHHRGISIVYLFTKQVLSTCPHAKHCTEALRNKCGVLRQAALGQEEVPTHTLILILSSFSQVSGLIQMHVYLIAQASTWHIDSSVVSGRRHEGAGQV